MELNELSQFIDIKAKIEVKLMAIQYLTGLTGSAEHVNQIITCKEILERSVTLLSDIGIVKKNVVLFLINISAEEVGLDALMSDPANMIAALVEIALDKNSDIADGVCMLLCNLSRSEAHLDRFVDAIYPKLQDVMNAFTILNYNNKEQKLHYIGALFCNLSRDKRVRQWLCNDDEMCNVTKIASFSQFEGSALRRNGAVGTLRNLCFDSELHDHLLNPKVDMLTYILLPLAGGEELDDDEMSKLPIHLQFLPKEKQRETDPDIRKQLIESLNKLCIRKAGREFLRDNGTYYILRELHKSEKDKNVLLACENVVDILIKREDEITVDDFTAVDVPEKYHEQFEKMDRDFLNE